MGRGAACVAIALAWGLAALAMPAQAAIHKCKDTDGTRIYSDRGCERPRESPKPAVAKRTPAAPAQAAVVEAPAASAKPVAVEAAALAPEIEAAPAPIARKPQFRSRTVAMVNWPAFFAGIALCLLAWLLHIIVAFRSGAIAWGVALILLSPLSNLLYLLLRPRQAWLGFVMMASGIALCIYAYVPPVQLIDVRDSYITARGTQRIDDRRPREQIHAGEVVYLKTVLHWDDWSAGGDHAVSWRWFTGEQARGSASVPVRFGQPPRVLLGSMPAADLGVGRHRVEVYVDGELFDSRDFEVVP